VACLKVVAIASPSKATKFIDVALGPIIGDNIVIVASASTFGLQNQFLKPYIH